MSGSVTVPVTVPVPVPVPVAAAAAAAADHRPHPPVVNPGRYSAQEHHEMCGGRAGHAIVPEHPSGAATPRAQWRCRALSGIALKVGCSGSEGGRRSPNQRGQNPTRYHRMTTLIGRRWDVRRPRRPGLKEPARSGYVQGQGHRARVRVRARVRARGIKGLPRRGGGPTGQRGRRRGETLCHRFSHLDIRGSWGVRLPKNGDFCNTTVKAGCRMQDAGCRMQDAGCRMQDAGCR